MVLSNWVIEKQIQVKKYNIYKFISIFFLYIYIYIFIYLFNRYYIYLYILDIKYFICYNI